MCVTKLTLTGVLEKGPDVSMCPGFSDTNGICTVEIYEHYFQLWHSHAYDHKKRKSIEKSSEHFVNMSFLPFFPLCHKCRIMGRGEGASQPAGRAPRSTSLLFSDTGMVRVRTRFRLQFSLVQTWVSPVSLGAVGVCFVRYSDGPIIAYFISKCFICYIFLCSFNSMIKYHQIPFLRLCKHTLNCKINN